MDLAQRQCDHRTCYRQSRTPESAVIGEQKGWHESQQPNQKSVFIARESRDGQRRNDGRKELTGNPGDIPLPGMKILIADKLSPNAVSALKKLGAEVTMTPDLKADDLPGQRRLLGTPQLGLLRRPVLAIEHVGFADRLVFADRLSVDYDVARALGYVGGSPQRDSTAAIDPKDGMALLQLLDQARLALRDGHSERAVELLGSLLEKNPGNLQARLTLVAAELHAGRVAAAVATARVALAANPDDDLVRFNLANALLAESRERPAALDEAREQYEQTLRLNPRRADAYLNYASLLVSAGETTEARRLLVRSETAGVEDPDLATERALLELMLGNREAAIRYLEQAVALDPGAADAVRALARLRGGPSATPKPR